MRIEGYCMGLVEGTLGTICPPPQGFIMQAMLIALKWMRDNPKVVNWPLGALVVIALKQAYPCEGQDHDQDHDVGTPQVPR